MTSVDDLKKNPAIINLYRSRVPGLKRDGKELISRCPLPGHKDDTPSFRVYEYENVWLWRCFGQCNASGNIFQFIQKMDNCDFKKASQTVENFVGSSWEGARDKVENVFKPYAEETEEKKTYTLEEYYKLEIALEQNAFARQWLETERGISYETAQKLHFGYRQDIGKIAGDAAAQIADKGWIVHPVIEGDKVVAIEYRSLLQKEFRKQPKMKTAYLFNGDAIDPLEPAILTEGFYDAAVLVQAGFAACSLPNGSSAASPEMKDALLQADSVILAGDSDKTGQDAMQKLWNELQERTYLFAWPGGCKDANETFLKHCGRDVQKFRALVLDLTNQAKSKPMQGMYSIQHSLMTGEHARLIDHPNRLRFPWKSVDEMAIILPGDVFIVYSTDSGMGKTTWILQSSIYSAKEHNEIVVDYQAEMSPNQIDTIFTSHLLKKDRLQIEEGDYKAAAQVLGSNFKYYIGRDTSLTTIGEVLDLIELAIKRFGATLVILDNLHFLCRNEQDQIKAQANAMQRIKNMAGKYGIKFGVLHQARKADQNHKRKVTHISDMDGSKSVQNDASAAFSMHRDEIKHSKDEQVTDEHEYSPITEIRLQKVREKGPGKSFTKLMFVGNICTFTEMAQIAPFREEEQAQEMVF